MKRKKAAVTPPEGIRVTVENWENVSKFLRNLANNIAVVPNFSSEIVRACLVVATFLEDRASTVRAQSPNEFEPPKEEKKNEPSPRSRRRSA